MREFGVIGLGRFGASVARTLFEQGYNVLGVDRDEARVQANVNYCTHVVQADATDEEALRSLGVQNLDVVVVSMGHNLEASVLTTLTVKEMGVREVVAKASSEMHGKVLQRIGADRVVFPERDMGVRVANRLISAGILDYLQLGPHMSITEINAGNKLAGHTLGELHLRHRHGVNVLAIRRGEDVRVLPTADDHIQDGDVLVTIGTNDQIRKWQKHLDEER